MVIDDLDIRRAKLAASPFKAYPPLIVDADTELTGTLALQGFQPVASQGTQFIESRGGAENFKPPVCLPREPLKLTDKPAVRER
jgi:hypothetical protein